VTLATDKTGLPATESRRTARRRAERWSAFYSGDTAHGLDAPGRLAALLTPLAADEVTVFVASTFHADLVLVPAAMLPAAIAALQSAGHVIA
jgi:hypothetical protein